MHAPKAPERLAIARQVRKTASCTAQPWRPRTDACHGALVGSVCPAPCDAKDAISRSFGVHFAGLGILRRVVERVSYPFFDVASHVVDTVGGSTQWKRTYRRKLGEAVAVVGVVERERSMVGEALVVDIAPRKTAACRTARRAFPLGLGR